MFQSLRQNSQIYVFHKDIPSIELGYINSISSPKPKYAVPASFGQQQDMIIDLTVKLNGSLVNYNGLPANLDTADSYSNGEQIFIADNREAMNAEILAQKQKSIDIINSVDTHKRMIDQYDKLLQDLNPEYAEKQQQQTEINSLKSQMSDMSEQLVTLTSMIERLTKEDKL